MRRLFWRVLGRRPVRRVHGGRHDGNDLTSNLTVFIEVVCFSATNATPYFGTVTRP